MNKALESCDGNTMLHNLHADPNLNPPETEECPDCNGKGARYICNDYPGGFEGWDPCMRCDTTGRIEIKYCPDCNRKENDCNCDQNSE